jgi:hypothetical protein
MAAGYEPTNHFVLRTKSELHTKSEVRTQKERGAPGSQHCLVVCSGKQSAIAAVSAQQVVQSNRHVVRSSSRVLPVNVPPSHNNLGPPSV